MKNFHPPELQIICDTVDWFLRQTLHWNASQELTGLVPDTLITVPENHFCLFVMFLYDTMYIIHVSEQCTLYIMCAA